MSVQGDWTQATISRIFFPGLWIRALWLDSMFAFRTYICPTPLFYCFHRLSSHRYIFVFDRWCSYNSLLVFFQVILWCRANLIFDFLHFEFQSRFDVNNHIIGVFLGLFEKFKSLFSKLNSPVDKITFEGFTITSSTANGAWTFVVAGNLLSSRVSGFFLYFSFAKLTYFICAQA